MSDYILSALFTNLDKPGLYANNKRIMTWQEFVAAGFSNSQVTRLVVPSLNSYANATINCPNLTEIYGDPTIARIKFSNLPSALKTVEGDATYLNVNQNPHYLLIDVDTTTTNSLTVHDDCVAIGAFVGAGSSNSQVSPSLTIPAGVKCIGPYAFGTPFYQTINVVGNDDLEIGTDSTTCFDVTLSGALPPE